MSWMKFGRIARTPVLWSAILCIVAFALSNTSGLGEASSHVSSATSAPSVTFPGSGFGNIPSPATGCWGATPITPINVTFGVTGVTGVLTNVETNMQITHSWVGDIRATLIAPNASSHVVFSRTGATDATAAGDSSNLVGPYNFTDTASVGTNWWMAAANEPTGTAPVPAGDYRSTTPGGGSGGGINVNITPSFSSITDSTGTWTLRIEDGCAGDTGAINAASLTLQSITPSLQHVLDFDGDGKTDYTVARENLTPASVTGDELASSFFRAGSIREKLQIQAEMERRAAELGPPQPGTSIQWWVRNSQSATNTVRRLGVSTTDFLVPNDYDGDDRSDIAVWRPGAAPNAYFFILQSQTSTVRTEQFGQTGDDPAITGDYDGDGIADVATYRCPGLGTGDGQCFFFFRGSLNNPSGNITYVPWGFGEQFDFFVNPGDFDGDGIYDYCIQRTDPTFPGAGQFVLKRSSDGMVEYINWGRNTDIIVPGDYDGDGRDDFCVSRTETLGGVNGRSYYILERDGGGTGVSPIRWGIAGDTRAPGDYDGDGTTDIAIWRANADPTMNFFYVRRSSDLTLGVFEWGQQNDFAVASWSVH